MKFFLAGIMQGSKTDVALHKQNYRDLLKETLQKTFPDAEVYDPFECNKNSLFYTPEQGKKVFLNHNRMCGTDIDVLIAFIPEASMGTAIEIWEAWQNGAIVISISPMATNWVVKFLSDAVYPDMDAFQAALDSGEIATLLCSRTPRETQRSLENFEDFDARYAK